MPLKIHDTTIREASDRYQSQRINISGHRIGYDPDAPTASAEWVKHNLNRVRDSLPNGYCARPAQQDCPHPNAPLTELTLSFGHVTRLPLGKAARLPA